mmetsp:Transcript_47360/g.125042  ORF Transcript_47360/g.125042 Transcript_47360/m.125042 type:complete len:258 (-) Transcript_47360:605-1378(-)
MLQRGHQLSCCCSKGALLLFVCTFCRRLGGLVINLAAAALYATMVAIGDLLQTLSQRRQPLASRTFLGLADPSSAIRPLVDAELHLHQERRGLVAGSVRGHLRRLCVCLEELLHRQALQHGYFWYLRLLAKQRRGLQRPERHVRHPRTLQGGYRCWARPGAVLLVASSSLLYAFLSSCSSQGTRICPKVQIAGSHIAEFGLEVVDPPWRRGATLVRTACSRCTAATTAEAPTPDQRRAEPAGCERVESTCSERTACD